MPKSTMIMFDLDKATKSVVKNLRAMQELNPVTPEFEEASEEAKLSFAKLLKYYEYAFATEKKGFSSEISEEKKQKLDQEAEKLAESKEVSALINLSNADKVLGVLVKENEGTRVIRTAAQFVIAQEPDGKLRFATKEQRTREEKNRAGLLAGFLDNTTSKSFTGKLKSWFIGNSSEYKNAINALKGFSKGEVEKEDAIESIKTYLDIRKSKVRDHQYGRDRFQGFMESLQTLMEPAEFQKYCDGVNKARGTIDKDYDPRHVQPEQFAPTSNKSVLNGLLRVDAQEKKQAAIEAEKQEKIRAEEQKKKDEADRARAEEQKKKDEAFERFLKGEGPDPDAQPENKQADQGSKQVDQGPQMSF